jgi:hypothetical protein
MTLDEARIAEAERRAGKDLLAIGGKTFSRHLCDVFNENWTPPVVDPDLLAAREYAATRWPFESRAYRAGHQDDGITIPAYLAGCTRGREGAKGLVEAVENAHRALSVESLPALSRISRALDALASAKRGG